ncbi:MULTISPECIES: 5-formyltetrahydrofolate cyclo-ligase [Clostridium]|uniref:5-formyltetrahydrofolate cyclo-ligase n=1 Tax=Clostridium aquiflavi TaxID=3073603 RepID=A0ABU1ED64_9CLOT|nr:MULTISPECIES: 5-formyltetrahydrofolate cyclo-ligase [unclassified Clostridium]MDR5586229.1 5-formyltetrahydrofolate cyclo-ligase [Clostridium sp. 5N-1]NFG62320.1 5-formyltetrahydrofolate cyclo-ligase [Clostridium botulinum]NFQ10317.1 5-formyltetrahydrofolate cyclo-ligase [Clostridium botulinum]
MNISEEKKELRKKILKIRKEMDINKKRNFDNIIHNKFLKSKFYSQCRNIFVYISYDSEIDTKTIIRKALEDGKNIYVPRTNYNTKLMEAVKISSLENLIKDKHGILQPTESGLAVELEEIDLIIMPGVAFDNNGGRMGYGGGFYDRYMSKCSKNIQKISLAYDFQILDNVPMDSHDTRVNSIITENKEIVCNI